MGCIEFGHIFIHFWACITVLDLFGGFEPIKPPIKNWCSAPENCQVAVDCDECWSLWLV